MEESENERVRDRNRLVKLQMEQNFNERKNVYEKSMANEASC